MRAAEGAAQQVEQGRGPSGRSPAAGAASRSMNAGAAEPTSRAAVVLDAEQRLGLGRRRGDRTVRRPPACDGTAARPACARRTAPVWSTSVGGCAAAPNASASSMPSRSRRDDGGQARRGRRRARRASGRAASSRSRAPARRRRAAHTAVARRLVHGDVIRVPVEAVLAERDDHVRAPVGDRGRGCRARASPARARAACRPGGAEQDHVGQAERARRRRAVPRANVAQIAASEVRARVRRRRGPLRRATGTAATRARRGRRTRPAGRRTPATRRRDARRRPAASGRRDRGPSARHRPAAPRGRDGALGQRAVDGRRSRPPCGRR